jgi:UDPglucose 6-dehydrogenase
MKISIIGTGYVGLVSGTCFAETGITVTCVDVDRTKIDGLNSGRVPIFEPGLDTMIDRNRVKGRLFFTTDLKQSLEGVEAVFIAVGTPSDEDGSADLKHILAVAREIGMYIDHYMVIVTKSTVPIGTATRVRSVINEELAKRGINVPFDMASNPEFLKEGNAIEDFLKPDRIVIGIESESSKKIMNRLYKPFLLNNNPIYYMDIMSAELTKYAANSMLATRISFMNEIARLCEIVGADVNMVRLGIGSDKRIGEKFLYPGVGYGGSCFPKDVKALVKTAYENNCELKILKAVEEVNIEQKLLLFNKLSAHFKGELEGLKIAVWGLSFKPNTDDMREAPSLALIEKLLESGATVSAYDPVAVEEAKKKLNDRISYSENPYDALYEADALMLVTEWTEFRVLNYALMKERMRRLLIMDGRNIYDPNEIKENGFVYYGVGR